MKGYKDGGMKRANLLVLCIWFSLAGLFVLGCASREEPVDTEAILARIHEGDERQQVLRALSDAWYHSDCRYADGTGSEVFLYGPKSRNKVTIVSVYFELQDERLIVDRSGIYENYFLDSPAYFNRCEPPVRDAFRRNTPVETKTP